MAVPFSNTKLRVPRGFQSLLEGLAREVLRNQPDDIYTFGAEYFEKLLKQREEFGDDPAQTNAELEDRFYNNKAFEDPDVDSTDPQMQDAALTIQTKFRQYQAKKDVHQMKEERAATKIQAGARGYKARRDVKKMKEGQKEDEKPTPDPSAEEIDIDLNDPETEKAAVKIQASFKGFKARQEVQAMKDGKAAEGEATEAEATGEPAAEEATDEPAEESKTEEAVPEEEATKVESEEAEAEAVEEEKEETAEEKTEDDPASDTKPEEKKQEEEEVDIDLDDPDVAKAATNIQAAFRGHKARKDLKEKQEEKKDGGEDGGSAEATE